MIEPSGSLCLILAMPLENNKYKKLLHLLITFQLYNSNLQPTNAFFITDNQILNGSFQLLTTAKHAVIKSNERTERSSDNIVGSWEEPLNI